MRGWGAGADRGWVSKFYTKITGGYKSFCRCPNLYWLYLTKGGGRPEKMSLTGLGSHEKPNI